MTDFVLIVVAHIDEHRIRIVDHLIDAIGLQILADVAWVKALVIDAVGHDALAHLEAQHPKGFAVVFQRDVQAHLIQRRVRGEQRGFERVEIMLRHADLRVDALFRHVDAAEHLQFSN